MRTSHYQIRKRIEETKSKITDEELFTSREFQAYLTDKAEAATKRYNRPVRVHVFADEQNEVIAYTDYMGIYINASNHITRSFPNRKLRAMSMEGFQAHECGHILFTDNKVWQTHSAKMEKGKFYPRKPTKLDAAHKLYAKQMQEAVLDKTDPVPRTVIIQTAHAIENILEDGYVDTRYSTAYPGSPARGIALNNLRFAELVPDVTEMIDARNYEHNIILSMLIQYVRVGEINNLDGYQGELLDAVDRYIPLIDDCLFDDDARSRCDTANRILIDLWPFMTRSFDALRDKLQQSGQTCQTGQETGQHQESGAAAPENPSDSDDGSAARQVIEEALNEQLPQAAPNFSMQTEAVPSDGNLSPSKKEMNAIREQASRVLSDETARIQVHKSDSIMSCGDGRVEVDLDYDGSGYEHAAEDIERVLDTMAEHTVNREMEQELSEELQMEADAIQYGNAHQGTNIVIHRMAQVDDALVEEYLSVAPDLLVISRRLQRSVRSLIEDKRQGGKLTGLLYGKRLDQKALYRRDGRIFYNTRLPTEPVDISVGLLVDESGSMSGNDRITRARATAIVMQDFCEALGIPILIAGHTALNSLVDIFSYADFDSVDRMDRYRLMDMSARDCNRDGAALRFVAEKLARRSSEVKLLIIISDGQPNDTDYSGTAAEADLRGIKLEYERKGIKMYAAAIGDDRDNIERIYGNGFLDITDLNDLPIMLTNLIARSMPL